MANVQESAEEKFSAARDKVEELVQSISENREEIAQLRCLFGLKVKESTTSESKVDTQWSIEK